MVQTNTEANCLAESNEEIEKLNRREEKTTITTNHKITSMEYIN